MTGLTIYQREDGKWAWHLKARNGKIIATDGGQGYENRGDCERTATAVVNGDYGTRPPAPEPLALTDAWRRRPQVRIAEPAPTVTVEPTDTE